MYIGDKTRIDITSGFLADFVENNNLYVDKTAFVEHVLDDSNRVLLFTRPRRMGKTLNLNTLAAFLDFREDNRYLFHGLYIEHSKVFCEINQHPVIKISFKDYDIDTFKQGFERDVLNYAHELLKTDQFSYAMRDYVNNPSQRDSSMLKQLMKNIYDVYRKKTYVFIDEYDKIIMDNIGHPVLDKVKSYITHLLSNILKDNPYLAKGVLTGVSRIAKESMFSGLNNLKTYDIFTKSVYDADFSLTEEEVLELVNIDEFNEVKKWYDNIHVGGTKVFNIYSVMSYLSGEGLKSHWASSGSIDLLINMIGSDRVSALSDMLSNQVVIETDIEPGIEIKQLLLSPVEDQVFYSLAVQAGYLTFDIISGKNILYDVESYKVYIPNYEMQHTWRNKILAGIGKETNICIMDAFNSIDDTKAFDAKLTALLTLQLSHFDFKAKQLEWTYHVFVFGITLALGLKCKSNREAGLGRYDILIMGRTYNAVIEFKTADSANKLQDMVDIALQQIEDKKYYEEVSDSLLPFYKIGIACFGKECLVKTVLREPRLIGQRLPLSSGKNFCDSGKLNLF